MSREIGEHVTDNAERRRHQRRERPPLLITLEGHSYQVSNWSLGGVLLTGYEGFRGVGEAIAGKFGFAGDSERCLFEGLVVRADPENREIAIGFAGLSDEAFDLLKSHSAV